MKKFSIIRQELYESVCPLATLDLDENVKNRQYAIDEYLYGPANPNEPNNHWSKLASIWGISVEIAKTMRCSNCAAFDISDRMRKCIETGMKGKEKNADTMATAEKADLGYCNILHFKCAGTRSCKLWLTNGPLDNADITNA
jgi:hypothetical protein